MTQTSLLNSVATRSAADGHGVRPSEDRGDGCCGLQGLMMQRQCGRARSTVPKFTDLAGCLLLSFCLLSVVQAVRLRHPNQPAKPRTASTRLEGSGIWDSA